VIDFERHRDLDSQVRAALTVHGVEPAAESAFFDPELLGQGADDWRAQVPSSEMLELWDTLAALAVP
jgi:hypothetical protein